MGQVGIALVGRQRLSDDLVREVGTIEIGRVDMVHPTRDSLSKNGNRKKEVVRRVADEDVRVADE
jgi:hypothetical protein